MSPYLAGGCLLAFVAWSGFMYHEGGSKESAICASADAKHDLAQAGITVAAQKAVIATVAQQQTVTEGVSNAYEAQKSAISNVYAAGVTSLQQPLPATGNGVGAVPSSTGRPHADTTRSFRTKVYS